MITLAKETMRNRLSAMKERLGILFLHYDINAIVLNNLKSIQKHNPSATIATTIDAKRSVG